MKMSASIACALALGTASVAAADDSFTCGERIIEVGMSMSKVRELCGTPTDEGEARVTYDQGPDKLLVVIHVQPDDTVGYIELTPRG